MSEGFTLTAFAGSIRASRDAVYELQDKHTEFRHACARGAALAQLQWEKRLSLGLGCKEFNANACLTMMKARFAEFREPAKLELSGSLTIAGIKEDDISRAQAVLLQSQVAGAGSSAKVEPK